MLENLRKQGSSVFIYAIFGILIAMFVINFRPGGQRGDDSGCGGPTNTAISIDGNEVNLTSFRIAYGAYSNAPPRIRTEQAFETLIRRELLADAARSHGLIVSDSLIDDEMKKGMFFLGGTKDKNTGLFDQHDDGTQTWNIKKFKNWVAQEFNVSLSSFRDEQQRELQARLMAELLGDEVRVSRDEALSNYLFDHNTVSYDSVVFKPDSYRAAMRLTDADVARFLATHEADVKARFTADQSTYEKVNAQIQIRQIVIAKVDAAPAAGSGSGAGSGSATAATKGVTIEDAKAKLEAAAAEIKAGKKKFADVAREISTDDATKFMGGSVGWRPADAPALGDKAVNDAIKTMKPGDVSPVITTDKAAYLVTVEGKREGKLEYDAVKLELAETLARAAWAREAAHRDALAAMDRVHGGKPLDQIFERAPDEPDQNNDLQKILNDPSLTPKQKQDILQQYIQMQQRHGSLTIEGKDIPVSWNADPDGAGGGSAAAPAPAPAGSGSAAVAAEDLSKPSSDTLPAFGSVPAPKISTNGPTPRTAKLPGLGTSKPLADALFDQMSPGDLAKTLYVIDGNFVVVQLVKKESPSTTDFDKDADHLVAEMRSRRTNAAVEDWLRAKCDMLAKSNRIAWNHDLLKDTGADGKPVVSTYKPCQSLHRGAAGGGEPGGLDLGTPDPDE